MSSYLNTCEFPHNGSADDSKKKRQIDIELPTETKLKNIYTRLKLKVLK